MLKVKDCIPSVYYNQSRDFQYVGRLFEIAFNYVISNIHSLDKIYDSDDVVQLYVYTLGLDYNDNIDINSYKAFCDSFIRIEKNKGSLKAIKMLCNLIRNVYHTDEIGVKIDGIDKYKLNIYLPNLKGLNMLEYGLDYLLQAGMTYEITNAVVSNKDIEDKLRNLDIVKHNSINRGELDNISNYNIYSNMNDSGNINNAQISNYNNDETYTTYTISYDIDNDYHCYQTPTFINKYSDETTYINQIIEQPSIEIVKIFMSDTDVTSDVYDENTGIIRINEINGDIKIYVNTYTEVNTGGETNE